MTAILFADHLVDLRKSGLSDATIAVMGARSLTPAELEKALGYVPSGVQSALELPYPSLNFSRFKLFPPASDGNGRSIRYLQATDSGAHLYIPPAVRSVLTDASVQLFWTEGEKKAARGTEEGFQCIGLGGLWNWVKPGTAEGISEFDAIVHVNRQEVIVPDSDVWARPELLQPVYALGKEIEARGAKVDVVILPSPDSVKVGLDDFLVANEADAFRGLQRIPLKHAAFTKQREWYPTWKAKRSDQTADTSTGQGTALLLTDPDPWPDAVDGAELLDAIAQVYARYVVLPDGAADAAGLWTLHTYLIDVLHVSPILALTSPQKRCGKSTLLDVLRALVQRAVGASNISAAALFRVIEKLTPTLLIDEADTFLAEKEELRGILNAGHTRSTAEVIRTVGDDFEPMVFRTYCPKVIAAIGALPETIEDRSIIIRMQRRAPGEHVERLRRDRIDAELEPLRRMAARWAADHAAVIRDADPDVPTTLNDRAADNWRPLLSIADATGGEWPDRARKAALTLSGESLTEDADVRVQLLSDLRDIFSERDADRLASETIVESLVKLETRPWAEWRRGKPLTANGLARLLRPFSIHPKTVRIGTQTPKGYDCSDFTDAWDRYLPSVEGDFNRNNATTLAALGETALSQPPRAQDLWRLEKPRKPLGDKACGGVAVETGELEEWVES